jgi:hypothetical protein
VVEVEAEAAEVGKRVSILLICLRARRDSNP